MAAQPIPTVKLREPQQFILDLFKVYGPQTDSQLTWRVGHYNGREKMLQVKGYRGMSSASARICREELVALGNLKDSGRKAGKEIIWKVL